MASFIVLRRPFKNFIYIFIKGFFFLVKLIQWEEIKVINIKGLWSLRPSTWKKVGHRMLWGRSLVELSQHIIQVAMCVCQGKIKKVRLFRQQKDFSLFDLGSY